MSRRTNKLDSNKSKLNTEVSADQSPVTEELSVDSEVIDEEPQEVIAEQDQATNDEPEVNLEVPVIQQSLTMTVTEILKSKLTFDEKIQQLKINNDPTVRGVINIFEQYLSVMGSNKQVTPDNGSKEQYNLLNSLTRILTTDDYSMFKLRWDVVNLYFYNHRLDVLGPVSVMRFIPEWKWGKVPVTRFKSLMNILTLLCDGTTRRNNLKQVDMRKSTDQSLTGLTPQQSQNLFTYYKVA